VTSYHVAATTNGQACTQGARNLSRETSGVSIGCDGRLNVYS
jgi:hypothetical protein